MFVQKYSLADNIFFIDRLLFSAIDWTASEGCRGSTVGRERMHEWELFGLGT